jgi:hypothetical protein
VLGHDAREDRLHLAVLEREPDDPPCEAGAVEVARGALEPVPLEIARELKAALEDLRRRLA